MRRRDFLVSAAAACPARIMVESPARRPRCGAPRLRATRRRASTLRGVPCGRAAFGV